MKLRLKELRRESGATQRQIAEYLGLKQQTYSRYETGLLQPSLPVMEKLSNYYNTSVDYIMGLTDDKTQPKRVEAE